MQIASPITKTHRHSLALTDSFLLAVQCLKVLLVVFQVPLSFVLSLCCLQ